MNTADDSSLLSRLWTQIESRPAARRLCFRIPDDQVLNHESRPFLVDDSYFGVRLSEMYIADAREFMRTFVPLSIAMTEFIYNGEKQAVPFFIGNQLLSSIDPYVKGAAVEFTNTNVAGPIPYLGGNVALYVGLYRAEVSDLSRKLLALVGGIVSRFDATGLTRYIDLAGPIGAGLADLLGMKEVEFRLGKRDEFTSSDDASRFRSGYLAYINADMSRFDSKLFSVREESLHIEDNDGNVHRFSSADYCLIKIEYFPERNDYTALPFHKFWRISQDLIWQSEPEKARTAFVQLVQELAKSPDLTRKHRFQLLQAYKANFEIELAESSGYSNSRSSSTTRSASSNSKGSAFAALQAAALVAPRDVQRSLIAVSHSLDTIPHLENRSKDRDLTDEIMNSQLRSLPPTSTTVNPDPEAMAAALTLAAFAKK